MPYPSNQSIGKCICCDWDLFYKDFLTMAKDHTTTLINFVQEKMEQKIQAYYQESASGNVHIALRFQYPLTVLDGFLIRSWMGDDETRLRLDLARYFKSGSLTEMNRCFQDKIKITNGQATLKSAGPWIRLELEPTEKTTQEAHTVISNMQEERRKCR